MTSLKYSILSSLGENKPITRGDHAYHNVFLLLRGNSSVEIALFVVKLCNNIIIYVEGHGVAAKW